jgi:tetratricopeptide (TPR) repeat protein
LSEFTQAFTSLGGFVLGAIGTLLAIIGLIENDKTRKRAQRIESNQLLSQAWDILDGQSGTTWIFGQKNEANRLEEARRLIVEALLKDPNYPKAHMYYGVYWQFMGDYGKALDCHRKAIELDVTYSSAYNNLGKTYSQLGDLDAEIENYRLALRHDPDFAYARYNLGLAFLAKEDAQGAIAELERVTQHRHCPAEVHKQLGNAYRKAGFASKAEEAFRVALELRQEEEAREEPFNLLKGSRSSP